MLPSSSNNGQVIIVDSSDDEESVQEDETENKIEEMAVHHVNGTTTDFYQAGKRLPVYKCISCRLITVEAVNVILRDLPPPNCTAELPHKELRRMWCF